MNTTVRAEIRDLLKKGLGAKLPYEQVKNGFINVPNPSECMMHVRKWAPDFEYVHTLLLRTIRRYLNEKGRVLDIGAGNGRLSKLMLEEFAESHVTLLDVSAGLLGVASSALSSFPDRIDTIQGDFFDTALTFPSESFDCIVSSFAVCHGRGESVYRELYRRIYNWLGPQSCFICLDHVHGPTVDITELGLEDWESQLSGHFGEEGAGGIIINTLSEDSPISVSKHLELLTAAGFPAVDVLWKKHVFALYAGFKGE
ncbi:MAG: Ubiquinone/menaquinone biosynthesis C-methyltransferase UbiE [Nitrosomonadaceae bacterium]|nr:Ubiquinone/menaquinone biosynthesis C-methyltransferase UbiE [Nitrosomonadaceae bacterium]